jgi:hypothetical protein
LYVNGQRYYTPWQADETREDATNQEEGERSDEEGVESVASIDSIAYNTEFFDPTEDPIASQSNYISRI